MRDPFTKPFCRDEDVGLAIPESNHAVSVCLPRWSDVIGYEEGDEAVLERMECGYPRFLAHPLVSELFLAAKQEFARRDETALVFPSLSAAWRCAEYVKKQLDLPCRMESYAWGNLTVVLLDEIGFNRAWKFWQHGGEIVSSRLAEAALADEPLPEEVSQGGAAAATEVRKRIAENYELAEAEDVFLFSSGMAAIYALFRVAVATKPTLPTIQVEFPYLDALKIQTQFNEAGVTDFSNTSSGGLDEIEGFLRTGSDAAAVFTELPSNPLLRTVDLTSLSPLLRKNGIPLFVDDTIATSINVDSLRYADAVTTSLTKTFSGDGDVAAGAVILNRESPFYSVLKESLPSEEAASPLFESDAMVLERNSRHYPERVEASNENALELVDYLKGHEKIEHVWHPSLNCREFYDAVRREEGGYGGLFSLTFKDGEKAARGFYDSLKVSKGPSLGTNFTLVCPYTLLAHFNELDWAAERGARRDLIRVWAGLEDPEDLLDRFTEALDSA